MKLRRFREIDRELARVGVDRAVMFDVGGVWRRRHWRSGRVTLKEYDSELIWTGSVDDALAKLAVIPEEAGEEYLWRTLCPREAEAYYRDQNEWWAQTQRLEQELKRVDASAEFADGGAIVRVARSTGDPAGRTCAIFESVATRKNPYEGWAEFDELERWSGSADEAMALLSEVQDGAGIVALWRAFKSDIAETPSVRQEARRRSEEYALRRELQRLGITNEMPRIDFRSHLAKGDAPIEWVAMDWRPRKESFEEAA
jgi:hypothetical protein